MLSGTPGAPGVRRRSTVGGGGAPLPARRPTVRWRRVLICCLVGDGTLLVRDRNGAPPAPSNTTVALLPESRLEWPWDPARDDPVKPMGEAVSGPIENRRWLGPRLAFAGDSFE